MAVSGQRGLLWPVAGASQKFALSSALLDTRGNLDSLVLYCPSNHAPRTTQAFAVAVSFPTSLPLPLPLLLLPQYLTPSLLLCSLTTQHRHPPDRSWQPNLYPSPFCPRRLVSFASPSLVPSITPQSLLPTRGDADRHGGKLETPFRLRIPSEHPPIDDDHGGRR